MRYLFSLLLIVMIMGNQTNCFSPAPAANYSEEKIPPYTLPDPLKQPNGNRVITSTQWNNLQRPYIYKLFETNVYGTFPKKIIPLKFFTRETNDQALHGLAVRKQVRVYLHPGDTTVILDILLYLPKAVKKPVPVFIGLNFSGNHSITNDPAIFLSDSWIDNRSGGVRNNKATDSSRGTGATQWQVEEIIKRGYAIATAYYGDIEGDHSGGWTNGIRTSLQDILHIKPEDWGAMGAWAWGLCRVLDYLQQDKEIDATKVAVMGHSRLGKAALWAGASDQRFAMVISNESGEGGAALSKRWYGETVEVINQKFPHWFAPGYKKYNANTDALPVDQHMLLSLIAPRPLYIASAEGDQWSDPKGEFLGAKNADPVYALFSKKGLAVDTMPGLNQPVGHAIRYHNRDGKHDVTRYDWQQYLNFADANWKNKN